MKNLLMVIPIALMIVAFIFALYFGLRLFIISKYESSPDKYKKIKLGLELSISCAVIGVIVLAAIEILYSILF